MWFHHLGCSVFPVEWWWEPSNATFQLVMTLAPVPNAAQVLGDTASRPNAAGQVSRTEMLGNLGHTLGVGFS